MLPKGGEPRESKAIQTLTCQATSLDCVHWKPHSFDLFPLAIPRMIGLLAL
jgi:hypothetical protein